MKRTILLFALLAPCAAAPAQEIVLTQSAPLAAICGDVYDADEPLPMNHLGMESGYALYEAEADFADADPTLEAEHVRDFAAVYLDGRLCGTLTDARRTLTLEAGPGRHTLRLYVENIGRITYGPEILDNSKGLFGAVRIGGEPIAAWRITPLEVRAAGVGSLAFGPLGDCALPCFRRGTFDCPPGGERYLDVRGWGMGEVWINGAYLGSYWDEERQRSIRIPRDILRERDNRIVVFDLKNDNPAQTMRLADEPIFE